MEKNLLRRYLIFSIKGIIAILVLWYLFRSGRLTKESLERLFKAGNIPYLMLSGIAFYTAQLLASIRLTFILKMAEIRVTLTQILKLTLIGNFFNMVLPGSVGGDVIKGIYLIKNEAEGKGRSSGIIIMDRVLGLFALLLLAVISILYFLQKNKVIISSYYKEIYLILTITVAISIFFLAVLFWGKNTTVRRKLKELTRTVFRNSVFYYIIEGFATITRKRRALIYTIFVSMLIQVLSLLGILVLVRMITTVTFSQSITLMAVSSVVMLFGIIPLTPGNIGWLELIASIGWSVVGSNAGGKIFLYWRIICILFSLPGAILYFLPQYFTTIQRDSGVGKVAVTENNKK